MTIKDVIKKFTNGEITYGEAKAEIKSLGLEYEDYEEIVLTLDKIRDVFRNSSPEAMRDDRELLDHSLPMLFGFIPNEFYDEIMFETSEKIRNGDYPPAVLGWLVETFGISQPLAAYFFSEAESRTRLKTLNSEEFDIVGQQWVIMQEQKKRDQFIKQVRQAMGFVPVIRQIPGSDDDDEGDDHNE
jgi:hypothetical protein